MLRPITFRIDQESLQVLDALAATMGRGRSYLINEAIGNYLSIKRWQIGEVKRAIAEADAGELATVEEVGAAFDSFRHHP